MCLVGLALSQVRCSDARRDLVWPTEAERLFVVLVPADWRGDVTQLQIQGPILPASATRLQFEATTGARLYLSSPDPIEARRSDPRLSSPEHWRLKPSSSELLGDPSCRSPGWVHQDRELELPLATEEGGSLAFELDEETSEFVPLRNTPFEDQLSYYLPLHPCFDGRRVVISSFAEATGGRPELLTYGGVQILDQDTVLTWSVDTVFAFVRDAPLASERRISALAMGVPAPPDDEVWRIGGVAMVGSSSTAVGIISLTRGSIEGEGSSEGRVFELRLSPEGFHPGRELWQTLEPTRETLLRPEAVAIDPTGRWAATGEGLVLTASSASAMPRVHSEAPTFDGLFLKATRSSPHSFVLGGGGYMRWSRPERGADGFEDISVPLLSASGRSLDAIAVRPAQPRAELFAVDSALEMAHWDPNTSVWAQVTTPGTEDESHCVHTRECGRPLLNHRGEFIAAGPPSSGSSAWLAPKNCAGVYLIDIVNACAVSTALDLSSEVVSGNVESGDLWDADSLGDLTVIVGERARVLDVRLE